MFITRSWGSCSQFLVRFTRGWTLQELIAPKEVLFFDARWRERGYKTSIAAELSAITKIDFKVLRNETSLSEFCVAQKLSWAARRRTTRKEDRAYSLLGLLDLNMPLLYGEGEKAFRRLQDEIIRTNADLSIFAWSLPNAPDGIDPALVDADKFLCGVLATSPDMFESCSAYFASRNIDYKESSVTNVGIKIRAQVMWRRIGTEGAKGYKGAKGYVLPLNCTVDGRHIGLRLRQVGYDQYLRANPLTLFRYDGNELTATRPAERQLLTALPMTFGPSLTNAKHENKILPLKRTHVLRIPVGANEMMLRNPWPADRYDIQDQLFFLDRNSTRDFATIDVTIKIMSLKFSTYGYHWVDFKFLALGWSSHDHNIAQFGILEDEKYAAKVREVQTFITDWDLDSNMMACQLIRKALPKSTVIRSTSEMEDSYVAHLSFVAHLVDNSKTSIGPFWRIELWAVEEEPHIIEGTWSCE
jgi:hypothetical protein